MPKRGVFQSHTHGHLENESKIRGVRSHRHLFCIDTYQHVLDRPDLTELRSWTERLYVLPLTDAWARSLKQNSQVPITIYMSPSRSDI